MGKLSAILFVKACLMLLWLVHGGAGLGPDEAQYWTWSQALDFGYYSKPPGIAWDIALGTYFLGNTEVGVRAGALVIGFFLPLVLYASCIRARIERRFSFYAALGLAFAPVGVLASLLATTDGGVVLGWTGALYFLIRGIEEKKVPSPWGIWLSLLFAALFKWTAFIFLGVIGVACLAFPWIRSWRLVGGCALSFLALLPSVIWNYSRGWPTFLHVWTQSTGGAAGARPPPNFWEFFGAQAVLLSPLLWGMLLVALYFLVKERKPLNGARFCGWVTLGILLIYCSLALIQKMQGNWCVFIYPLGLLFLAGLAEEKGWVRSFRWAVIVAALFSGLMLALPRLPVPLRMNPFKECLGWKEMQVILAALPLKNYLVADTYQTTSLLSFYGPHQKRAYFLNLHGRRHNQFSYWPGVGTEEGGGYFVWVGKPGKEKEVEEDHKKLLEKSYGSVNLVGFFPLARGEKTMMVLSVDQFNGFEPRIFQGF